MNEPIAKLEAIAIDSAGLRFPIVVALGSPCQPSREPDIWRFPVSIEPLHPNLSDIAGRNAFQSLCLAACLVIRLPVAFIDKGDRITTDDSTDAPLAAYIPVASMPPGQPLRRAASRCVLRSR